MNHVTTTTTIQQPVKQPTVQGLLTQYKDQIQMALPKHLNPDRMVRIIMTEIRKNPELANCEPVSFMSAVIQCAQLGLEPGSALGHAYLIPYYNSKKGFKEVQLIPGYRGLIDIARRSGVIDSISARAVYENDEFSFEYGLNETIKHVPAKSNGGELVYVYAIAKFKDGGHQFEVMSLDEINRIKNRSKRPNPVWQSDFSEMARKTAVRRLFKYLPVSIEIREKETMQKVIDINDSADVGMPNVDLLAIPQVPPENSANAIESIFKEQDPSEVNPE